MQFSVPYRLKTSAMMLTATALLSGCATLPSSGPTARQVERGARNSQSTMNFQVVDLDTAAFRKLAGDPVDTAGGGEHLASLAREGRVDAIAPGDELQINIYEVG